MNKPNLFFAMPLAALLAGTLAAPRCARAQSAALRIGVDPLVTRNIEGSSALDRQSYFGICDPGINLETRLPDPALFDFLVRDLDVKFGRQLGPVNGVVKYIEGAVVEDPQRPGFADLSVLQRTLAAQPKYAPSPAMKAAMGQSLGIAAHGQHLGFPEFLGQHSNENSIKDKGHSWIPENIAGAAEISAAVMRDNYTDFTRPNYYEPINEPHWSFFGDKHLANWHLATRDAVKKAAPDVQVGGPCMSVAYFYNEGYRPFNGMREFIDNTGGELDFYSFHVYDFLGWKEADKDFNGGRITSGLPLEGVLDLMQGHMLKTYGKRTPIVISEHGGYVPNRANDTQNSEAVADRMAARYFPRATFAGSDFEWEMKKRSITDFNLVSSAIANTLTFMDHPEVKKAVPFILLESMNWDPRYYSVLYVPENFTDKTKWVATHNLDFYKFFRGVQGRRVQASSPDPDVQVRAFVDGSKMMVVANNLWTKPETLDLDVPLNAAAPRSITVRRFGRNLDFTPYIREETATSLQGITLNGRESVVVIADYGQPLAQASAVNEVSYYGTDVITPLTGQKSFAVAVSDAANVSYATVRVGLNRPANASPIVNISVNGQALPVPTEDEAARLTDEKNGYGTTKIVAIPAGLLRENNEITVSFPDGKAGTVGNVVIRAAHRM